MRARRKAQGRHGVQESKARPVKQAREECVEARKPPRLSVILCTYNRRNMALSALASLRRQTLSWAQFEVIVVDNGSSDGTLEAARAYVNAGGHDSRRAEDRWQVQCLSEPQNGLASARETGLLAATGEIAIFLDDDTLADPYFLERLLQAYEETGADAIGGRVELRWEAPRPHWLPDDLLDLLGYFAPSERRIRLNPGEESSFSSCCFSVKIEALRRAGSFAPFLSKRRQWPTNLAVYDLCCRLHAAGCQLWYEPEAVVAHRVPAARLNRAFFRGRAYWQGRAEIAMQYAGQLADGASKRQSSLAIVGALGREVLAMASQALLYRPLLWLAGHPSSERLQAAMEQARHRGRFQQYLQLLEHAPLEITKLAVLLIASGEAEITKEQEPAIVLLAEALRAQGVSCTVSTDIPLSWLWQHRAGHRYAAMGVIHFYRPGMLDLNYRRRQRFWFRLWLARRLGIRMVTTDAGGWWQSERGLHHLARRTLERRLLYSSDLVLAATRLPEQLYPDKKLRRRLRCLPQPGFRGYYTPPVPRQQAHRLLGLPRNAPFVYLCLAHRHTERELLFLIEAFSTLAVDTAIASGQTTDRGPQLLLAGAIGDRGLRTRIMRLAAYNPAIHLSLTTPGRAEMPLYLGAADALVLPHGAIARAGILDTAMLALSYERIIVAPDLPRFQGMLPPTACLFYEPASHTSLVQALSQAPTHRYTLSSRDADALDASTGWSQYARRLMKVYHEVLQQS